MSRWWNQQVGTMAQGQYDDPMTAISSTMIPSSLIPPNQIPAGGVKPTPESLGISKEDFNRYVHVNADGSWSVNQDASGAPQGNKYMDVAKGFLNAGISWVTGTSKSIDKKISNTPVIGDLYNMAKDYTKWTVIQPIDKAASGAHWLYSETVSQPMTTAILQMGKAVQGNGQALFSGSEWSDAYSKAEHISPGQAFSNIQGIQGRNPLAEALMLPMNPFGALVPGKVEGEYQNERYLYDTNYWQKQNGWKYSVGSGLLDAQASMYLDPTIAAGKVLKPIKAITRGVEIVEGAQKGISVGGKNIIGGKTAEELVAGRKFQNFANEAYDKNWSPVQIQNAMERGRGSRYSAFTSKDMSRQLSEALYHANQGVSKQEALTNWQLAARFAMGDTDAFTELAGKSQNFALAYGKALDHRVNVLNADKVYRNAYGGMVENGFQAKGIKPATFPNAAARSGAEHGPLQEEFEFSKFKTRPAADRVNVDEQGRLFVQSPYVKSIPENIAEEANKVEKPAHTQLAFEGEGFNYQVKPIDPASLPPAYYTDIKIPGLVEWSEGVRSNLEAITKQLENVTTNNEWVAKLIADPERPALNPLFGSMKEARFAGVGRNVVKQSERRTVQYLGVKSTEGFQSRLIQNGIYGGVVRFIGRMGDRLPTGVINHNDADAASKLSDYLKASALDNDNAASLVQNYSKIASKTDSGKYLDDVVMPMVFEAMGKKYNMDIETVQELFARYRASAKSEVDKVVGSPNQAFTAATIDTPKGPIRIDQLLDGERVAAHPMFSTQLQYTSFLPNLQKLDRFMAKNADNIGRMRKAGMSTTDALSSFMESYNQIFKFGSLARIAYPLRNLTEETAARAAKFGAMSIIADTTHGASVLLRKAPVFGAITDAAGRTVRRVQVNPAITLSEGMVSRLDDHIAFLEQELSRKSAPPATFAGAPAPIDEEGVKFLQDRLDNAKAAREEFDSYRRELLNHAIRGAQRSGEGTFMYRGQAHAEPFNTAYAGAIPAEQITSSNSWQTVFGRIESFGKEDMMRSGNWVTLTPKDLGHLDAWERAVNFQILQDPVGKKLLADPTGQEAVKWLRSPEGSLYRKNLGVQGGVDPGEHVQLVKHIIDQYIPDAIREQATKNGKVAAEDFKAVPIDERPPVHGDEIRMALGGDRSVHAWVDRAVEKWFNSFLVRGSSDRLSWQPTYVRAHRMHYQELVDKHFAAQAKLGKPVTHISQSEMNKFMQMADKSARQTMREILYEPSRTNLSNALRYISPFFSAHADSLARWGGLIAENPDLVGKMAKIYNAPVAANLVTDKYGNRVDESGNDIDGNFVGMNDRFLSFQINPLTKNLPPQVKNMEINVGSLNVITPGQPWWNPGFGPVVTIPADTIMRNYPNSAKLLSWMNPYGSSAQSFWSELGQSVTPGYIDTAIREWDPDGQQYQDALMASYRAQMVDYHQNGGPAPDWQKAEQDASRLVGLHVLSDFILPGKARDASPYQFYVDAYKKLQNDDASTAKDKFMAKYGKDFKEYSDALMFTAASTKSKTGIPSTVEGLAQSEAFGSLIKEHPELGGFIVGDTARSGEFNNWVLLNQKASGDRTVVSAADRVKQSEINAGWEAYIKISDAVRADMINRGGTNLQQKGMEDLAAIKRQAIYAIANKYEAWADAYTTTDRDMIPKRIAALNQIVSDQRIANDPLRTDVKVMREYLTKRAEFQKLLMARKAQGGSNSLASKDNQDVARAWDIFREAMAEKDTKFSNVMDRYLANDSLQFSVIG